MNTVCTGEYAVIYFIANSSRIATPILFHHIGLLDIGTGPQLLSLLASISLRQTTDNDRFLMRIDFNNPLVGLQTINSRVHNHVQNQDICLCHGEVERKGSPSPLYT